MHSPQPPRHAPRPYVITWVQHGTRRQQHLQAHSSWDALDRAHALGLPAASARPVTAAALRLV